METKVIKINVEERIIKSLKICLDLKSAYGTFEAVEDEFCCRIGGALRRREREITIQLSDKK